jgi:hypothetical protein
METWESTKETERKSEVRKFHKITESIKPAFNSMVSARKGEDEIITGKVHMLTDKRSQQVLEILAHNSKTRIGEKSVYQ